MIFRKNDFGMLTSDSILRSVYHIHVAGLIPRVYTSKHVTIDTVYKDMCMLDTLTDRMVTLLVSAFVF